MFFGICSISSERTLWRYVNLDSDTLHQPFLHAYDYSIIENFQECLFLSFSSWPLQESAKDMWQKCVNTQIKVHYSIAFRCSVGSDYE